jgi:hypothetical protein
MGSSPPVEIARESALGEPVLVPPRLIRERRDPVLLTYQFLDAECARMSRERGRSVVGLWVTAATIAAATDLPESTVRVHALGWMDENKHVRLQKVMVKGRERTMIWCLWLFPDPFARVELDAGQGVLIPADPGPRLRVVSPPDRRVAQVAPPLAPSPAPGVPSEAPSPAPSSSKGIKTRRKTTDRPEVVVVEASPERGEAREDAPAPPLPAKVAELLEREIEPAGRPAMEAKAAEWCQAHPPGWVSEAIELGIVAYRDPERRKDPKRRVRSLVAFIATILDNWRREGRPEAKLPPDPKVARAEAEAKALAEKRAQAEAARQQAAHELALKELWESLPWPEKEKTKARLKADNPGLGRWGKMLDQLCYAAMEPRLRASQPGA